MASPVGTLSNISPPTCSSPTNTIKVYGSSKKKIVVGVTQLFTPPKK